MSQEVRLMRQSGLHLLALLVVARLGGAKVTTLVFVFGLGLINCGYASPHDGSSSEIDFQNQVIPVLTKFGCNSGACHGAALGRGGLKLSLYGGNPFDDHAAIVRERSGRRVNIVSPEQSLLLAKPSESISHGGGLRFDLDSEPAQLLKDWIAAGTPMNSKRVLERVEVQPNRLVLSSEQPTTLLKALAYYSDGTHQDVSKWTVFQAEDDSAVQVAAGKATVQRAGRHIVVARFLTSVVPIELILPLGNASSTVPADGNWIDDFVVEKLNEVGLPFADGCNNLQFLRRVRFDLTGRLPTHAEIVAANASGWNREAFVDELLSSEEFVDYWTLQFAKLLRIRPQVNETAGMEAYMSWLHGSLEQQKGYDQIVRELLLSKGDSHEYGPANFFRTTKNAGEQTEFMTEFLMGSRLRCANCHNHPLDQWTQDDYHGLAAILAKVDGGRVVSDNANGKVIHPRTKEVAISKLPGLGEADALLDRRDFTEWLVAEDNPFFSKAIVNRLWRHMLGRGLVEPVDDFRATNPPTHPELLQRMADDFASHSFRIRHTLRSIANSATYARQPHLANTSRHGTAFYAAAESRDLQPEVLADAISDVLGVADRFGDRPEGTRAVELWNPTTPSNTLDVLGRCDRVNSCETVLGNGGLAQKLHMFNGDLLNQRISSSTGTLGELLAANQSTESIVTQFYFRALCRYPTDEERDFWTSQLAPQAVESEEGNKPTGPADKVLEDFVWSILTCNEFVTNH